MSGIKTEPQFPLDDSHTYWTFVAHVFGRDVYIDGEFGGGYLLFVTNSVKRGPHREQCMMSALDRAGNNHFVCTLRTILKLKGYT